MTQYITLDDTTLISGSYKTVNLAELVSVLMRNHQQFVMRLRVASGAEGFLYVRDGVLLEARLGDYTGIAVLIALLEHPQGIFAMLHWEEPPQASINLPFEQALLQATVALDEMEQAGAVHVPENVEPQQPEVGEAMLVFGYLSDVALSELVQQHCRAGHAARICIRPNVHVLGNIYIAEGKVLHASLQRLHGLPALAALFEHHQGEFQVYLGERGEEVSINLELEEAMLQASTYL